MRPDLDDIYSQFIGQMLSNHSQRANIETDYFSGGSAVPGQNDPFANANLGTAWVGGWNMLPWDDDEDNDK